MKRDEFSINLWTGMAIPAFIAAALAATGTIKLSAIQQAITGVTYVILINVYMLVTKRHGGELP